MTPSPPLYRYDPTSNKLLEGEEELAQEVTRTMLKIAGETHADSGQCKCLLMAAPRPS